MDIEKEFTDLVEAHLLANNDNGLELEEVVVNDIGRGVIAKKDFHKNDFLVEYSGEFLDLKEAKIREAKYFKDKIPGGFMYFFRSNEKTFCIDATSETGRLGRLLNHSKDNPNCATKIVYFEDIPRLILVAKHDIKKGSELLFDYGDRALY